MKVPIDAGILFELGLITYQLYINAGNYDWYSNGWLEFDYAVKALDAEEPGYYAACLWRARTRNGTTVREERFWEDLEPLVQCPEYTTEQLMRAEIYRLMPPEEAERFRNTVIILLDGRRICPRKRANEDRDRWIQYQPQVRDGRAMAPLRPLAEALGADVGWDQETQRITVAWAGATISLRLGEAAALRDGNAVPLDAAPYAENGVTFVPACSMAALFGQTAEWDPAKNLVTIVEDRSTAGNSNLEAWVLPMGALLEWKNKKDPALFGGLERGQETYGAYFSVWSARDYGRDMLSGWGVNGREALIATVVSMTYAGHNAGFLQDAAILHGLTESQYRRLLSQSGKLDKEMWPFTKALDEKWGEKGILAWDLFRMADLVQWGYVAGYLTYPEALALAEPSAGLVKENFANWDQAYENYLDGYHWWARTNTLGQDVWESERGKLYLEMKADPRVSPLFNDDLFMGEIIPVPGIQISSLLRDGR